MHHLTPDFTLRCSWGNGDLQDCGVGLLAQEGGMQKAETIVQAALETPSSACTFHATGTAAPWLELRLGSCGAVALCVVANARVLEIHEAAVDDGTAPLLTQEAQLSAAHSTLCAHFVCHGGDGALLPAHGTYRLKLFGRTPRDLICVRTVCLVLLPAPTPEPPVDVAVALARQTCSDAPAPSSASAPRATAEADVVAAVFALQRQMLLMERRVSSAMEQVVQRLSHIEARVERLEAVPLPCLLPADVVLADGSEGNVTKETVQSGADEDG